MKKHLLFGGVALMLALTGCGKDDSYYTYPATYGTLNVVTAADGTTTIEEGSYSVSRTVTNTGQNGVVGTNSLYLGSEVPVTFVTVDQSYQTDNFGNFSYFKNVKSATQGVTLTNADFLFTRYYYWPDLKQFVNEADQVEYAIPGEIVVASYQINNNYTVTTFQPKTCFVGTTTTSYTVMGNTSDYTTEDIPYMLVLDIKNKKAKIVMLKAKFSSAPNEPVKEQVILEGLDLNYYNGIISVTGTDVVPLMVEGGASTPNENYTFSSINFRTTNAALTSCEIDYVVHIKQDVPAMGMTIEYDATGKFTGSYIANGNP